MSVKNRLILLDASEKKKGSAQRLWNLWSPKILVYLHNKENLSRSDGEDLLQEVMGKVFQSLDRYNPFYSPATWIYTIAARTLSDWKEKQKGKNSFLTESQLSREGEKESFLYRICSSYPTPEEETLQKDSVERVRQFILSKEGEDRQLLFLICYEGLSGRKAAALMGLPATTARDRLRKLKKELREVMQ